MNSTICIIKLKKSIVGLMTKNIKLFSILNIAAIHLNIKDFSTSIFISWPPKSIKILDKMKESNGLNKKK